MNNWDVSGREQDPAHLLWVGSWGLGHKGDPPSHTCYKFFFSPYLKTVKTNGKFTTMYDELIPNLDQQLNIPVRARW